MNNDLERSVRFLEDALSTSGRGLFKKDVFKEPKRKLLDLSISVNESEMDKLLNANTTMFNHTLNTMLLDKTISGTIIQKKENTPWKSTVNNLYMEFYEILQSHSGGQDVLEVLSDLARCCSDALKVIQNLKSKISAESSEEERWLENERNTWRLLFILYQDRLSVQNLMEDDESGQYFGRSEKLCMQNLFKRDHLLRECQLVIDWLESNASDKVDQVLHFADTTVGWENTLHQLQAADTIAFGSSRQTVSQLDPDAPHYQGKPLHDLDQEDEKSLNKKIFAEIRSGNLERAQNLCRESGQAWRSAILEGWRLFHDPSIKETLEDIDNEIDAGFEEETNEQREIEGNRSRDIWKAMALQFSKQDYLGVYEKAAVATLCGYLESMLPVCHTWEDHLWAYMKCMVDIRVESEIRDCVARNDSYMPLPEEYWAQRISINDVFERLESSRNNAVRNEAKQPEHIIQKQVIMDQMSELLSHLEEFSENSAASTQFLRFIAHLVLFLDQIGQGLNRECVEKVLEAYIKRLMEMKETQLVAYYVSKLNHQNQVLFYASYLEKIIDEEERKECLSFADDSGLDVFAITKQVVENIRNKPHEVEHSGNLQQKLTEMDKFKISSLDWVIFNENQRAEAVVQCNALIFTFLTLGKLDAAQLAFNKIPSDSVQKILSEGDVGEDVNQAVKDYMCYKAYLDAHEAFNEWFRQCKSKPSPPEDLPEQAQFQEKVSHQHRVQQYKTNLERWKITTNHLTATAKSLLYNVLLFPEGWLSGAKDAEYLRSTCIPEIVMLLYSVLFESGLYEECVQLADLIASERHALYKVYSKEKLGEILIKLCECSVALLNTKKDPWGNEAYA